MTASDGRALPAAALAAYLEAGYCVGTGLLAEQCIDRFLQDVGGVLRAQLEHRGLPVNACGDLDGIDANLATIHGHDQTLYIATLVVFSRLKSLYDLFMSDRIAAACRQLGIAVPFMHTLPVFHILSNRLRIDGGYHGYDVHQDWTSLQSSLNAVTVWVPFHNVDGTRFPLEVLPQSHLQGLYRGAVHNNEYPIDPANFADKPFTAVEVKKGDVVFMSPFAIHRTRITDSEALRIAASWRYEDAVEHTFIDRKYPLAHTRVVRHDLFYPNFPDAEQMRQLLTDIRIRQGTHEDS